MDAIDLLEKDHRMLRGIFHAIENAGDHARARGELFLQLDEQLTIHEQIEEEIFLPAVAALPDGRELVAQHVRDDATLTAHMDEIEPMDPAADEFVRKVKEIQAEVERHMQQEEAELFPFARARFDAIRLADLGRELQAREKALSPRDAHAHV